MKIEKIFTAFMVVFVGMALIYMFKKHRGGDAYLIAEVLAEENQTQTRTLSFYTKTTGSLGSGDALIELTPSVVDKNRLVVKFRLNTHSVRLSQYDLTQITTLEYEGKEIKPVKASRLGGHHSSGTIIFNPGENISSFTIRIKGIPRIEERFYKWKME